MMEADEFERRLREGLFRKAREAIKEVYGIEGLNEETKSCAVKEIKADYRAAKMKIHVIRRYKALSSKGKIEDSGYRYTIGHFREHYSKMRDVPARVRRGAFRSEYFETPLSNEK